MRVRITAVTLVSDGHGRRYRSGWEGDVPDELGAAWAAAGLAVGLDEDTEPQAREGKKTGRRAATRRAPRTAQPPE